MRTASGDLWTSGAALGFSSGGTAWTRRARNVAAFASWAIRNYVGGLYITSTGTIMQFHASTRIPSISVDYAFRAEAKTGDATGKAITKVFASDGTYLALSSDGGVYAWGGNLDNGTRGNPKLVPSDNVVDLNVGLPPHRRQLLRGRLRHRGHRLLTSSNESGQGSDARASGPWPSLRVLRTDAGVIGKIRVASLLITDDRLSSPSTR